jgi:hypothetical protein
MATNKRNLSKFNKRSSSRKHFNKSRKMRGGVPKVGEPTANEIKVAEEEGFGFFGEEKKNTHPNTSYTPSNTRGTQFNLNTMGNEPENEGPSPFKNPTGKRFSLSNFKNNQTKTNKHTHKPPPKRKVVNLSKHNLTNRLGHEHGFRGEEEKNIKTKNHKVHVPQGKRFRLNNGPISNNPKYKRDFELPKDY